MLPYLMVLESHSIKWGSQNQYF